MHAHAESELRRDPRRVGLDGARLNYPPWSVPHFVVCNVDSDARGRVCLCIVGMDLADCGRWIAICSVSSCSCFKALLEGRGSQPEREGILSGILQDPQLHTVQVSRLVDMVQGDGAEESAKNCE
jgi:hypothetical protein